MLDPQASELGCAVRMKIIERTTVRLFLVVSYHKNIPEVIVARDFSYLLPDTGMRENLFTFNLGTQV